jgi:hypothetical protein
MQCAQGLSIFGVAFTSVRMIEGTFYDVVKIASPKTMLSWPLYWAHPASYMSLVAFFTFSACCIISFGIIMAYRRLEFDTNYSVVNSDARVSGEALGASGCAPIVADDPIEMQMEITRGHGWGHCFSWRTEMILILLFGVMYASWSAIVGVYYLQMYIRSGYALGFYTALLYWAVIEIYVTQVLPAILIVFSALRTLQMKQRLAMIRLMKWTVFVLVFLTLNGGVTFFVALSTSSRLHYKHVVPFFSGNSFIFAMADLLVDLFAFCVTIIIYTQLMRVETLLEKDPKNQDKGDGAMEVAMEDLGVDLDDDHDTLDGEIMLSD